MSANISFKEFMEQVEERLKTYSKDTLSEILMEWAKSTHPSRRSIFLAEFVPPSGPKEILAPDEELLGEIRELAKKLENGDYCDGWGWDDEIHEERDWGDESWAEEVDDFYTAAHESMMAGHYKLAKDAYALLFDILSMGEEPGHLPGSLDPEDMLDTDLEEARACYLRSVYLSAPLDKRSPMLWKTMQKFRYCIGENLNLQSIINAEREPLPDFAQFLTNWISFLKKQKGKAASYLLREAVMLSGGISAIAKLAREESKNYPRAYIDWVKSLEKEGDFHSTLKAAKEGLANVPKDYTVRAKIAEAMSRAGEHLGDLEVQLAGWREAFYSDPSLSYLLSLLSISKQMGCSKEEIEIAIGRIVSLLKRERKDKVYILQDDNKPQESSASATLLNQAYLLAGSYREAFNLCKNKESLGWSFGNNPKGMVIPFFLKLLSRKKDLHPAQNVALVWKEAISDSLGCFYNRQKAVASFQQAMDEVFQSVRLPDNEENKYLYWCIEETGQRVDAIVGGKHRKSYYKAANLLVALAEMLANRGEKSDGNELIEKYRLKYHRYSAFRKELNKSLRRSNIFTEK